MSQAMSSRPSSLLSVKSPSEAFCFDRAIWLVCSLIEQDLQEADTHKHAQSQRQLVINTWLGLDITRGRFKDPAGGF